MTRKDFELVAEAVRMTLSSMEFAKSGGFPYDAETAIELLLEVLSDKFEKINPRFNRRRFISASTLTEARREIIKAQLS